MNEISFQFFIIHFIEKTNCFPKVLTDILIIDKNSWNHQGKFRTSLNTCTIIFSQTFCVVKFQFPIWHVVSMQCLQIDWNYAVFKAPPPIFQRKRKIEMMTHLHGQLFKNVGQSGSKVSNILCLYIETKCNWFQLVYISEV